MKYIIHCKWNWDVDEDLLDKYKYGLYNLEYDESEIIDYLKSISTTHANHIKFILLDQNKQKVRPTIKRLFEKPVSSDYKPTEEYYLEIESNKNKNAILRAFKKPLFITPINGFSIDENNKIIEDIIYGICTYALVIDKDSLEEVK